jgi:hypothetical protein
MRESLKSKAARYGLFASIFGFGGGMIAYNPCDYCFVWFVFPGIAAVLPSIWGARLVRVAGIGCCAICFSAGVIVFLQERGLDVRLRQSRDGGSTRDSSLYVCDFAKWTKFTPPNAQFTVLMPAAPSATLATNNTSVGPLAASFFTAKLSRSVAFTVVHNQFPTNMDMTNPAMRMEGARQQLVQKYGKPISDTAVLIQGHQGREWRFEISDRQQVITMRACLDGYHMYQAISVMPKASLCEKHVREFLDSFNLSSQ